MGLAASVIITVVATVGAFCIIAGGLAAECEEHDETDTGDDE